MSWSVSDTKNGIENSNAHFVVLGHILLGHFYLRERYDEPSNASIGRLVSKLHVP